MRRISLALALVSAFAAGCSGGSKPAGTGTGTAKGVAGQYFYVNLFSVPVGGVVSSSAPAINCGASAVGTRTVGGVLQYDPTYYAGANACGPQFRVNWTTDGLAPAADGANLTRVTLAAAPRDGNGFIGWAGDCSGTGDCVLEAGADKTVIAIFAPVGPDGRPTAHPSFTDPALHGPAFAAFASGDTAALACNTCHGANLQGMGIAPACNACHDTGAFTSGGHGDATAEAWGSHGTGWSAACQRCHTSGGFRDWVGVDGSADYLAQTYTGSITATATTPPGGAGYANGPLTCASCHNSVTDPAGAGITRITFPSSVQVTTDKVTALCGQCHGARESTVSVDAAIAASLAAADPDAQMAGAAGVSFRNPHYRGAAATMFGSVAKGWAQYPNQVYTGQNLHGGTAAKCTACHDAHTLEIVSVSATSCGRCHFDEATGAPVTSLAQIEEGRQFGFEGDIDGDGFQAGLNVEIDGLNAKLLEAMQAYAFSVAGQGICFDPVNYPYFMKHAGAAGVCAASEISAANAFKQFTPRLMRAAYNLKFSTSDSAAWAHNPRYAIEVLFDAIMDLNAGLRARGQTPVAFSGKRSFNGHFGAAGFAQEPYAQFLYHPPAGSPAGTPGTGFTTSTCYQCHGGQGGFEQYLSAAPLTTNLTTASKVTGMACTTCHAPAATDTDMSSLRSVPSLFVPPQKNPAVTTNRVVSFTAAELPPGFALCASCHTGLENMASVDNKIATMADPALFTATFVNGHYFGAAGIILGTDAKVLYEYAGKTYQGKALNFSTGANGPHGSPHGAACTGCHNPISSKHSFEIDTTRTVVSGTYQGAPNTRSCDECHIDARPYGAGDYRLAPPKANLASLAADLLAAMQAYATASGRSICYSTSQYPYFLIDTDGNGACNGTELSRTNAFLFDAKLLKAAYNYQWFVKDPGAAEHNYLYMGQVLFDAIDDLGGVHSVVTTRP